MFIQIHKKRLILSLSTLSVIVAVASTGIGCNSEATVASPTTIATPAATSTNPQVAAQAAQQAEMGKRQQQLMQQQAQMQARGNVAPSK
ncbi:MAG: hypothetical protein H8F28_14350 [Fibrella sp.]|nr:hypothetical protein [Armatimonadota bacterium]